MRKSPIQSTSVTIRRAAAADTKELNRLAQLDSQQELQGSALVAEIDSRLVAAISLQDGQLIADPFQPTADIAELLQRRALQMNGSTAAPATLPQRLLRALRSQAKPVRRNLVIGRQGD